MVQGYDKSDLCTVPEVGFGNGVENSFRVDNGAEVEVEVEVESEVDNEVENSFRVENIEMGMSIHFDCIYFVVEKDLELVYTRFLILLNAIEVL
jgi:hypothetical protein